MLAIFSTLAVIGMSVLMTRIATILLRHTGLTPEMARFQARSAFTGAGFTTSESESVVNHPVRRRIIFTLMLIGNAGIVSAIATLLMAFVGIQDQLMGLQRIFWLLLGVSSIWLLARSRWIDVRLSTFIARLLRRYPHLHSYDLESLLQLGNGFRVQQLLVNDDNWIANRSLAESHLRDEGIMVLGFERMGEKFYGAPIGHTLIKTGDKLVVYGPQRTLDNLCDRRRGRRGDAAHDHACKEQAIRQKAQRHDEVGNRLQRNRRPHDQVQADERRRRGDVAVDEDHNDGSDELRGVPAPKDERQP